MKLRCAVVGHGSIGRIHAQIAGKYGELCAVCDVDRDKLVSFSEDIRYTDYTDMLDRAKPDVVHICTPHYLHAEMVIAALERGINVLCEKPLCIRREDIGRILEAEERSSAILGVCLQNRYNCANLFIKDLVDRGEKKIRNATGQVVWHRDAAYYASGEWRGKWDTEGGGVLINQALHTLDLLIWLCGEPNDVRASISNLTLSDTIEVEDTATIVCRGEHPFIFLASNASSYDCPVEITLFCEDGEMIKIVKDKVIDGDGVRSFSEYYAPRGKECYGSGHEALICDFYSCIEQGKQFSINGAEGAKVIKVILGVYAGIQN